MRRRLLTAFLLSSLGLATQSSEPSAPSSDDSHVQQKSDSPTATPSTETVPADHPASVCADSAGDETKKDETKIVHVKAVTPGVWIKKVAPKYPKAARKAHVEGTVLLCAVITKDGTIASLRAVSGPELLIASAEEAVQQWRYKPYLLDGEAVEVTTEIRVNF